MIGITEIAPEVYRVDNGRGRAWTVYMNQAVPRIETESGARICPESNLGSKILKLITLQHPKAPYLSTV